MLIIQTSIEWPTEFSTLSYFLTQILQSILKYCLICQLQYPQIFVPTCFVNVSLAVIKKNAYKTQDAKRSVHLLYNILLLIT